MFAIIATGGKQYRVEAGDTLKVEKMPKTDGKTVTFSDVLLVGDEAKVTVGSPLVKGASVTGEVVRDGRAKKVMVRKFKSKVRYRRLHGHRQAFTEVKINAISVS